MRQLNGVYTRWFNRALLRVGHAHPGRFKATLIEREGYPLELARRIADAFSLHISTISRAIANPK